MKSFYKKEVVNGHMSMTLKCGTRGTGFPKRL